MARKVWKVSSPERSQFCFWQGAAAGGGARGGWGRGRWVVKVAASSQAAAAAAGWQHHRQHAAGQQPVLASLLIVPYSVGSVPVRLLCSTCRGEGLVGGLVGGDFKVVVPHLQRNLCVGGWGGDEVACAPSAKGWVCVEQAQTTHPPIPSHLVLLQRSHWPPSPLPCTTPAPKRLLSTPPPTPPHLGTAPAFPPTLPRPTP